MFLLKAIYLEVAVLSSYYFLVGARRYLLLVTKWPPSEVMSLFDVLQRRVVLRNKNNTLSAITLFSS